MGILAVHCDGGAQRSEYRAFQGGFGRQQQRQQQHQQHQQYPEHRANKPPTIHPAVARSCRRHTRSTCSSARRPSTRPDRHGSQAQKQRRPRLVDASQDVLDAHGRWSGEYPDVFVALDWGLCESLAPRGGRREMSCVRVDEIADHASPVPAAASSSQKSRCATLAILLFSLASGNHTQAVIHGEPYVPFRVSSFYRSPGANHSQCGRLYVVPAENRELSSMVFFVLVSLDPGQRVWLTIPLPSCSDALIRLPCSFVLFSPSASSFPTHSHRHLIAPFAAYRRGTQCTTENGAELWDVGSNWDRDARRRIYGTGHLFA